MAVDRLSSLDDTILSKILSFLPTKEAVRTSLLCRSFRRAWTSVSDLTFVLSSYADGLLVDHVISLRNPDLLLDSLTLVYSLNWTDFDSRLPLWIDYALRRRVRSLALSLRWNTIASFLLLLLRTARSLESLSLRSMRLPSALPTSSHLHSLRVLHIADVDGITDKVITGLVASLPVLEDLSLDGVFHVLDLSVPGLRRMRLVLHATPLDHSSVVRLECPSLEVFELSDATGEEDGVYEGDLPSLVEARVLRFRKYLLIGSLIESLRNARVLHFTPLDVELLPLKFFQETNGDLPTFHNLRNLHLEACFHDDNIDTIIYLLERSPYLQTLDISLKTTSICKCRQKIQRWTARKHPFEVLNHLKEVRLSVDISSEMVNEREFMRFLSINVKQWESVTKSL